MDLETLKTLALDWLKIDPSPSCRSYIQSALDSNDENSLKQMFSSRIAFGTAGLRSKMAPGHANMNDLIIIQTAQGLASYVKSVGGTGPAVVGYDHRREDVLGISSERFGRITKRVFEEAGIKTILLSGLVPTPLIPYSVQSLSGCCGVMVTASHNPKSDDGYKLYWSDGCQITSPIDGEISESILKGENLKPWVTYNFENVEEDKEETKRLTLEYFEKIKEGMCSGVYGELKEKGGDDFEEKCPKFAYTAMHGVGAIFAEKSFEVRTLRRTSYYLNIF